MQTQSRTFILLLIMGIWLVLACEFLDSKEITRDQALCLIQGLHTQEYCLGE